MTKARVMRAVRMAAIAAGVLLTLAAAGHGVAWWLATDALAREAGRWIDARAQEGIAVHHATARRGGWPMAARLTLPAIEANGRVPVEGQGLVPIALQARAVTLEVALLRPRQLRVVLDGPFQVATGPEIMARGEASLIEVIVPFRAGTGNGARFVARALSVSTAQEQFRAERLDLHAARDPAARGEAPGLVVSLAASGVDLPESRGPVLGSRVARAELELQVIGQPPPFGSPHAQAVAWRDAGGFVQVPRLLLDWGPLSLAADATLALDQAVQPSGAGRARVAGLGPTLDTLGQAGLIPRQAAQAGRSIIAFMQRTPPGGGPPVVELPLTLQDRMLSAGRITLVRLPPLVLPH